jgi:formate hydrogenlyase subunit 3/multisubunit Na+/H+ antiporter MnhD subunit
MQPLLAALAVLVGTGLVALLGSRSPRWATGAGAAGPVVACVLGLPQAFSALSGGELALRVPWTTPYGDLALGLDRLSAFFLVPVLVLAAIAALYGRSYLSSGKRRLLGPPAFFFNVLVASMVLTVLARDAILLLVGWELTGLTSFLLVTFEHRQEEVRRAGWVYLVASQGSGALLIALVVLIRLAGGAEFAQFQRMAPLGGWPGAGLVALAVAACGVKAGFVPLHVWLPEAHAAAPSHMSALMSGASIKIGLYALLRALTFLPPARWWGPAFLILGFVAAVFGISQALVQRDLKRVLAYSSIENMGLILIGLGIAWWGTAMGAPAVAALGAFAAGFHLWSHALMKGLLFLSAGSVLHGTGTRDLERLGGLARRMPWTSAAFLFGAVAIAGLPPLNGFVGEWLLLRGLFAGAQARGGAPAVAALLAVGGLALVGALAALCFVRACGIALLGSARGEGAAHAHESPPGMLLPMLLLAGGCASLALRPGLALGPVGGFAGALFGADVAAQVGTLAPSLATLGTVSAAIALALALLGAVLAARTRKAAPPPPTWDCGYAAPTARMQYTSRSFAQIATAELLPRSLSPRSDGGRPRGLFPRPATFTTGYVDPVLRSWYEPFLARWADRFSGLRSVHQGVLHASLFYILVMAVAALAWVSLRGWAVR